jgi:hypothetical protein
MTGQLNGDEKPAKSDAGHIGEGMNVECSHAKNEEVSRNEIQPSPKDIDRRRGKALPRRLGEGALERPPREAADEMRNGVGQEEAAKKIRNVV